MLALLVSLWSVGTARAADGDAVVLGAVLTLSGAGAAHGRDILAGYSAAVAHVNDAGGVEIAGVKRPLELVFADDFGSNDLAATLALFLVDRRGVDVMLGGARRDRSVAIATALAGRGIPVVGLDGLPPGSAPPGLFSVAVDLPRVLASALGGAALAYRLAGRDVADIAATVSSDDPLAAALGRAALDGWGFGPAGGAPGLVVVLPPSPTAAAAGLTVVLDCGDVPAATARHDGLVLCASAWPDVVAGQDLPAWLAQSGTGAVTESRIGAAVAVLVAVTAIETGRSTYGPAVASVLPRLDTTTFAGRVRFIDGVNVAVAPRAFQLGRTGLRPFDPADPLELTLP